MPDLIANGSFEATDSWTFSGNAERRDDLGSFEGSWAARLFVSIVPPPPPPPIVPPSFNFGFLEQSFPLVPGEVYSPTWHGDGSVTLSQSLRCEVDCGDGALQPLLDVTPSQAMGWTAFSRSFTAIGTLGRIRFSNLRPGVPAPQGFWLLDAVSIPIPGGEEAVARHSKHAAFNAIIARLKLLRGGTAFHTDLGDRVFPALVEPEAGVNLKMPYACFPLVDEFTYEMTQRGAVMQWSGQVHVFVPETAADALQSTSSVTAAKAHDDLAELFLQDDTLDGTVAGVELLGGNTEAGVYLGGTNYGEILFRMRFTHFLDGSVLGP